MEVAIKKSDPLPGTDLMECGSFIVLLASAGNGGGFFQALVCCTMRRNP